MNRPLVESEADQKARMKKWRRQQDVIKELREEGYSVVTPPLYTDPWLPAISAFRRAMGWPDSKQIDSSDMPWLGALRAARPLMPDESEPEKGGVIDPR